MKMRAFGLCTAVSLLAVTVPAEARRTAVDQNPDGTPLLFELGGYCDFNGDECAPDGGVTLPYSVSFGGGPASDRVWVQGNSILTFGNSADFSDPALRDPINNFEVPLLTAYNRTLVSAGQSLDTDFFGGGFLQTGELKVRANGSIFARWYFCQSPASPTSCPADYEFSLLLRPTSKGFLGTFDFSKGSAGSDIGYVIDGVFTPTGTSFLMPASFSDNVTYVPEPASWALLIAGFGLTGAAMRRRRTIAV